MAIVKIKSEQAKNMRGVTDWSALKNMTDVEIRSAIATDLVARELKPNELAQFKRVKHK